ncbi:hypothetical protein BCR39DRAFT_536871 [Naematelia encephala]|uniref:N-acetyltransferase domain-containing protein n=1 Tax=Naematelia encephala TaxID=71784 RepID=A0A1Y2AZ22_9TREE|nr:hypothetical protein BCR39DRAFT_536871 [Naematelia encephala]
MSTNKPDTSSEKYKESLSNSLRWDQVEGQAYIQLPSYPNLRLVPFRQGIEDEIVTLFSHEVIAKRLFRLPYPMYRHHAEEMISSLVPKHQALLAELSTHLPSPPPINTPLLPSSPTHIPGFPFKSLVDTTTGRKIGDLNLAARKAGMTDEEVLKLPSKEQDWVIGYVLDPGYHGKGIMSEMVGCLIDGWIKNWMDIRAVTALVEDNNTGSIKVVLKNGLVRVGSEDTAWPEEKGGGIRPTGQYERKMF